MKHFFKVKARDFKPGVVYYDVEDLEMATKLTFVKSNLLYTYMSMVGDKNRSYKERKKLVRFNRLILGPRFHMFTFEECEIKIAKYLEIGNEYYDNNTSAAARLKLIAINKSKRTAYFRCETGEAHNYELTENGLIEFSLKNKFYEKVRKN